MSLDRAPEGPVAPQAAPGHLPPREACPYCGSVQIVRGLRLGQRAEAAEVGVKYEASGSFLGIVVMGTEPLRVDLCDNCGTVARLYVGQVGQKWSGASRG